MVICFRKNVGYHGPALVPGFFLGGGAVRGSSARAHGRRQTFYPSSDPSVQFLMIPYVVHHISK